LPRLDTRLCASDSGLADGDGVPGGRNRKARRSRRAGAGVGGRPARVTMAAGRYRVASKRETGIPNRSWRKREGMIKNSLGHTHGGRGAVQVHCRTSRVRASTAPACSPARDVARHGAARLLGPSGARRTGGTAAGHLAG
jgi:hypothetical protein